MADNPLSNLTTKQKLIAAIFIVILLVVGWQVIGLFGSDTTPPEAPVKPASTQSTAGGQPSASGPAAQQNPGAMAPSQQSLSASFTPGANKQLFQEQQSDLSGYLDKVNKLQTLNVERQIAETSQAIAAANLATATADKSMSKLLTEPVLTSAADYGSKIGNPNNAAQGPAEPPPLPQVGEQETPSPQRMQTDYIVVSVSMQLDKWSAVLGYQNKLYSVTIGDKLPPDGSVVSAIGNDSVTLLKDKKSRKINIISTI